MNITTIDAITGETTVHKATDSEIKELEEIALIEKKRIEEIHLALAAKAALLDRLGITADEAKLLLA